MNTELVALAQFGFSAVAFYLVWMAYKELQPRLMDIIQQNAEALARVAGAMEQVVKGQDEMAIRMGRIDDRLLILEEQHKRVGECPLERSRKEPRDGSADYHVGVGSHDNR
jgi:hypothetical protein